MTDPTLERWMATHPRIHAARIVAEAVREYMYRREMAVPFRWMLGIAQSPAEFRVLTMESARD